MLDIIRWATVVVIIAAEVRLGQAEVPWGCNGMLDIAFILDQSESIRENDPVEEPYKNWNLLKNFMKSIMRGLPLDGETRTSMIKYSTTSKLMWSLSDYASRTSRSVLNAVDSLDHEGGNTYTASALRMARNDVFTTARGRRFLPPRRRQRGVRRVALLMTDGLSTIKQEDTPKEADLLRANGVDIYVVAIGKYVDEAELRSIATDYDTHVIVVADFGRLEFVQTTLIHRLCDLPDPPPPTDTAPVCDITKMDLAFLIDNSGSIREKNERHGPDNYDVLRGFLQAVVDQLDVGIDKTRIAAVRFAEHAVVEFDLNRYNSKRSLKRALARMGYRGGNTNTAAGLRTVTNRIFQPDYGDRPDIPNVILLITDGQSTHETGNTRPEAIRAKVRGAQIYVVGLTNDINERELRSIASDPDDEHYFDSSEIKYLNTILINLVKYVCTGLKGGPQLP